MEKQLYYKLECPSTEGDPITLNKKCLLEMMEEEVPAWEQSHEGWAHPLEFTITPVFMTEQEFNDLPEYQF